MNVNIANIEQASRMAGNVQYTLPDLPVKALSCARRLLGELIQLVDNSKRREYTTSFVGTMVSFFGKKKLNPEGKIDKYFVVSNWIIIFIKM